MAKGSFIVYDVDLQSLDYLTYEQIGRLFSALSKHRLQGIKPDFGDDRALQILFHQMSEHIAINEEKYKATCKRNAESAKKRWSDKNDARACAGMPTDANACVYDTDTDTDNDTDTVTETDTEPCGAKKEKRKNYYGKKNNFPALLSDEPTYDAEAFMRKAIGLKYDKKGTHT